ncbi:transgelin-3-like [Corticium candelabrum]|uniref:transgelin-3-like n=1 Tax=Corticium candelabrum TaxID=121492 RepID=UPI002E25FE9D|nr:transgelin-3-like [Corticium candelabrum]
MGDSMRATKSGIGADIQKKMEAKYDAALEEGTPQKVIEWVNAVLAGHHDPCPGFQAEQVAVYFKNGVALCKLMNLLTGGNKLKFNEKSSQRFVCMGQIENFVKAAESEFGMKNTETFQANDLFEGLKGNMINVVNSLHELGLRSNQRGFSPRYAGAGKMAEQNVRGFTDEEIKKASAQAISKVSSGSHGGATQSGMSFGTTRKI